MSTPYGAARAVKKQRATRVALIAEAAELWMKSPEAKGSSVSDMIQIAVMLAWDDGFGAALDGVSKNLRPTFGRIHRAAIAKAEGKR